MADKIVFWRETRSNGGSIIVAIPPEVCEYMDIKDGTKIGFQEDQSKHGKFVGIWNPKQQVKQ